MLKRFWNSITGSKDDRDYRFYVRCGRCGEIIQGRIDLYNDLSRVYPENGDEEHYYTRKVVMGNKRCFQRIETEFEFNLDRSLKSKTVTGGAFVSEDDFNGVSE